MRHAFGIPAVTKSRFGKNQSYEVLTPNGQDVYFPVFGTSTLNPAHHKLDVGGHTEPYPFMKFTIHSTNKLFLCYILIHIQMISISSKSI